MKNLGVNVNTTKDFNSKMLNYILEIIQRKDNTINIKVYKDGNGLDEKESKKLDAIIVLGGDGTILNTLKKIYKCSIPILGINLGHLGFLAQVESTNAEKAIDSLFNGKYTVEERSMIQCSYDDKGETKVYHGLNDVVLNKGIWSRIQKYEVFVDKNFYNMFNADGVIVCTPTGSTAYNLSAGGPMIHPKLDALSITPMYSQSLTARTIVLDNESDISVSTKNCSENVFLSIDGQGWIEIDNNKTIDICKSPYKCKLIKLEENNYFNTLRKKIIFRAKECEEYEGNQTR